MFTDEGQTRGSRPRLRQVRSALELRTKSKVTFLIAPNVSLLFGVPPSGGFSAALRWQLPPKGGTQNCLKDFPVVLSLALSTRLLIYEHLNASAKKGF
jgi:hypothetical protein